MSLDGKIGRLATQEKTVVTGDHPAVLLSGRIITGIDIWPGGTILTRVIAGGALTPWGGEPDLPPAGVLTDDVDSVTAGAAVYLAHGTVALTALRLNGGAAPGSEQIDALARAGIYAV